MTPKQLCRSRIPSLFLKENDRDYEQGNNERRTNLVTWQKVETAAVMATPGQGELASRERCGVLERSNSAYAHATALLRSFRCFGRLHDNPSSKLAEAR